MTGRPSIHGAAHHAIGRRELGQRSRLAVFGLAGDGADLVEAALVDQAVDAFAHREPAAVVLALHLVGAAHLAGHALARPQFVQLRLPGHKSVLEGIVRARGSMRCRA